ERTGDQRDAGGRDDAERVRGVRERDEVLRAAQPAALETGCRLGRTRERRVETGDRGDLVSLAHLPQQLVVASRPRQQRGGQNGVPPWTSDAPAPRLPRDDRAPDRPQALTAAIRRHDEADVAHLGELPPLRRLEAARVLLHDAPAVLERSGLGEEVPGGAAQQLLVVGELEAHELRSAAGRARAWR